MEAKKLKRNALFNPSGDTEIRLRKMIGGNTTNLNDFNNMRYKWVSDWYRQAMNNFWIPEEINLTQDTKDYPAHYQRIHHGQRSKSLPAHPGFSGMCAQSELQLYARHNL